MVTKIIIDTSILPFTAELANHLTVLNRKRRDYVAVVPNEVLEEVRTLINRSIDTMNIAYSFINSDVCNMIKIKKTLSKRRNLIDAIVELLDIVSYENISRPQQKRIDVNAVRFSLNIVREVENVVDEQEASYETRTVIHAFRNAKCSFNKLLTSSINKRGVSELLVRLRFTLSVFNAVLERVVCEVVKSVSVFSDVEIGQSSLCKVVSYGKNVDMYVLCLGAEYARELGCAYVVTKDSDYINLARNTEFRRRICNLLRNKHIMFNVVSKSPAIIIKCFLA